MVALFEATGCAAPSVRDGSSPTTAVITGRQLLVATADSRETSLVDLYALERTSVGWKLFLGPVQGVIGRNGFAPSGEKREGDGRTPTGIFPLEFTFGYASSSNNRMPYRQATQNDLWVDDAESPEYNTWQSRGESRASSFEEMKRRDDCYRHGIVVGYNRNPVVRGKGSAIFVHVRQEEGVTTSGCVALAEAELVRIIAWLDPAARPQILMGTRQYLEAALSLPALPQGAVLPGGVEPQVRATAAGIGERRVEYRTPDGFFGMAMAVPPAVAAEMERKKSWKAGCPVPVSDLSYLVLSHWGFDGMPKAGELVVHRKLALPVVKAFADLFADRFPIERMELIDKYDGDDDRSMAANNTSAFNCRDITGKPGFWSRHSYGVAIDINPLQNPYISPKSEPLKVLGWDGQEDKGDFLRRAGYGGPSPALNFCNRHPNDCIVLPPAAAACKERKQGVLGMLLPETRAVKAFTDRGFDWGGTWQRLLDYQHFEYK